MESNIFFNGTFKLSATIVAKLYYVSRQIIIFPIRLTMTCCRFVECESKLFFSFFQIQSLHPALARCTGLC